MTDTGQIPGEGLPENAGMVEQPGIPAPDAHTFLDPSEHTPEDDDLLLMPTSQGAWSDPQAAPPPRRASPSRRPRRRSRRWPNTVRACPSRRFPRSSSTEAPAAEAPSTHETG
ncbi:nicotinate-nucleotide--dimethylbenzimidazole phosphoribosyltransferase, partial [Streptomyces sp. Termitarium-T10T-6]